ncbi:MAG: prolipoprotein diacylglyceryl transferase family protein [Pirellulales bacterium]
MRTVLFDIPNHLGSLPGPLFGWGWLLLIWAMICVGLLAWLARRPGGAQEARALAPIMLLCGAAILFVAPSMLDDQRMLGLFDYLDRGKAQGQPDESITEDEATENLRDDFAAIDVNHDGAVSRAEVVRHYGQLPIRGFGVMLLVAVTLAMALAIHRARQMRVNPDLMFALTFCLFISGILGARVFYVVQYWNEEFRQPSISAYAGAAAGNSSSQVPPINWPATFKQIVSVQQGGLVVYGSVIGGLLGLLWFTRRHKMPMLATTDLVAPSLALAQAFGRVGCFLNGCCFGGACELPWAVTFPPGSPPFMRQMEQGQVDIEGLELKGVSQRDKNAMPPIVSGVRPGSPAEQQGFKAGDRITAINGLHVDRIEDARSELAYRVKAGGELVVYVSGVGQPRRWQPASPEPRSGPVHPTQLYSFIDGMVICLFLLAWWPYRRRDGEITAWLLTLYPITRFLMEWVRTDEFGQFGTSLTISQYVSLLILAGAGLVWCRVLLRPKGSVYDNPPPGRWLYAG